MKIYGSGTGNYANTAQVNDAGFLYVAGSISSMPSLTTSEASVYKMSGTTASPGSVNLVGGWFAGSAYPLHLETGSNLLIIGSVRQAVVPWEVSGLVNIGAGSVSILSNAGSIPTFGSVFTTGSINIATSLPTIGSYAGVGSIIGSVYQLTSPWTISGTANVSGAVGILTSAGSIGMFAGVNTIFGVSGTIVGVSGVVNPTPGSSYLLSTPGSVGVYGGVLGSIVISGTVPVTISTNPVPISGNALGVSGTAFQQVWIGTGSVVISGISIIAGQSGGTIMPLMTTAGSVLQTQPLVGSNYLLSSPGSISVYTDGNVGSVVLSGTSIPVFRGVGSVLIMGYDSSATLDSPLISNGSYLMVAGSISSLPTISTFGSIAISGNVTLNLAGGSTYPNFNIIRKQAGSPFDNFIFAGVSRSIMVENLGSNSIYVNFDANVNAANSGTMFLYPRDVISLDLQVGSVNIQSSGIGLSTLAQVIGIR